MTNWGIIGPGNIARQFATGLKALPDANLVAVGSRSQEKADAFGVEFGIPRRYADYRSLAEDKDVEVVYIATPHSGHEENALLCIGAGKAVLCEKPFTINAQQAQKVVDAARAKKIFVMEAMWTRFFPLMVKLRAMLSQGVIGEPSMLQADFGFRAAVNPASRLFNPALGGGGLLDVGVYPVSLSSMIFGTPNKITGVAELGTTGVDEMAAMALGHPGGPISLLATAVRVNTPQDAVILGTEGNIKIHSPWWKPSSMTVMVSGKDPEQISIPYESNGFQYEAQEVQNCLRAGKLESSILPLDETLAVMRTMDTLRAQWGLKYPME